jgi:SAM-dependent methyltransferase
MSDALLAGYEELPYESFPLRDATPEVLAIAGLLRGVKAARVEHCRVLELGCATGGNLFPIALAWPGSRCVGIDLSPRQIEMGEHVVRALSLSNVELKAISILDIEPSFGEFDYILCHGVFSWAPENVRRKILSICRENLAENGIAYISYNTYPGWHVRGMFREMIAYNARKLSAPKEKVQRSRGFLEYLAEVIGNPEGPYSRLMMQEAELLGKASDTYLFHEHLEEFNQPFYFHQFAELCAEEKLRFLGETRLSNLAAADHSAKVREALLRLAGDEVEREQYLDFLVNRTFRHSLLVHEGSELREELNPGVLAGVYAESNIFSVKDADLLPMRVRTRDGVERMVGDAAERAILLALNSVWPRATSTDDLAARAGLERDATCRAMLDCYMRGMIELRFAPPRFTPAISACPVGYELARHQVGQGVTRLSTPRHRAITVSDFARLALSCMDGEHTHAEIAEAVTGKIMAGDLTLSFGGQAVTEPGKIREGVAALLPEALQELSEAALLVW